MVMVMVMNYECCVGHIKHSNISNMSKTQKAQGLMFSP